MLKTGVLNSGVLSQCVLKQGVFGGDDVILVGGNASATLNGFGSMSANAKVIRSASAALSGVGSLSADANIVGVVPPISGSATLSGEGSMSASARAIRKGVATLNGFGTVALARAKVTRHGSATLDGVGSLSANATLSGAVSLPASTEFWLDATDINSYDNVTDLQTWKNVVTSPSSGASQITYDVNRGTTSSSSTDDPTFTGTAGDSGAYFSYDGGDLFLAKYTNTFIQTLTRSDQTNEWWAACHFRRSQFTGGLFTSLFSSSSSVVSEHGGAFLYDEATGDLLFWRRNATGNTNAITIESNAFSLNTDYLVIFGYNSSTGEWSYYKNGKTLTASGTNSPPTSTVDGSDKLGIGGADGASGSRHPNTARQYQFGMGNTALTSGIVSDIVDYVNQQSGTSYS